MAAEEPWIGIAEVAVHLGVSKDRVYRWVDTQGLPAHRVGRLFRFRLSQVDEWVQSGGGRGPASKMSGRSGSNGREDSQNG